MNSSLRNRILSAVVGIILIVTFLVLKGWFVIVPATILALVGIYEFHRAFEAIHYKPILAGGLVLSLNMIAAFLYGGTYKGLFTMAALMIVFGLLGYHVFSKHSIVDIFITVFSVVYVVTPFVLIMALAKRSDNLIWLVFIIAFASDSFAYFAGKRFGKHKLIEAVSPNKTIEGALGGVVGCVVATIIFKLLIMPEMSWTFVLLLGVLGSIASQIGDLTASKIKRQCDIKDFGNIIPGHGGVLDRFDSILFTAPMVFVTAWVMSML